MKGRRAPPRLLHLASVWDHSLSPQDAVKVMAKSLVRNRHAVTKMYGLKSELQAVSLRLAVSTGYGLCLAVNGEVEGSRPVPPCLLLHALTPIGLGLRCQTHTTLDKGAYPT